MALRKTIFAPGEYYHIYNRGNSKQKIFNDNQDYDRFVKLLYLSNSEKSFVYRDIKNPFLTDRGELLVAIGAHVLMPNHFHLLVKEIGDNGITKFFHKLSTSYSKYYNARYERTGKLFEGEFRAEDVENDTHLKYLFSYIHLNPVKLIEPNWREFGIQDKQKTLNFIKSYKYGSYSDLNGEVREEGKILFTAEFPEYFSTPQKFNDELFEWLEFSPER